MSNEMEDWLADIEAGLIHISSSSDGHEVYYDPSRGMYCVRVFLDSVLKYETWFDPYDVVESIVHAEWIKIDGLHRCSKCNTTCPYDASGDVIEYWDCPRCPKCGAHMG